MKGYKFGVAWIAVNDAAGDDDPVDVMAGYLSVALLADMAGKDGENVAADVIAYRKKHKIGPYKDKA